MVALNVCLMKKGITINDLNSHHRRSERQTNLSKWVEAVAQMRPEI